MDLPDAAHGATPAELKARIAARQGDAPFLLFRDGDGSQRIVDLTERQQLTIGRQLGSDLALTWDAQVSRVHAVLERVNQEWTVIDDGLSRNGSWLNGERIQGRRRLRDGDALRVGRTTLVFQMPSSTDSRRTEASDEDDVPQVSEAQRRVLVALCRPYAQSPFAVPPSNKEIADELVVGVETVKTHLRALFEAFGVQRLPQHQKRAQLAARALASGAVSQSELFG